MYGFEEMIEMGLREGETWKSDAHRVVAVNMLILNPRITTRDLLMEGVSVINQIPDDQIRKVTVNDLVELGCPGLY